MDLRITLISYTIPFASAGSLSEKDNVIFTMLELLYTLESYPS